MPVGRTHLHRGNLGRELLVEEHRVLVLRLLISLDQDLLHTGTRQTFQQLVQVTELDIGGVPSVGSQRHEGPRQQQLRQYTKPDEGTAANNTKRQGKARSMS